MVLHPVKERIPRSLFSKDDRTTKCLPYTSPLSLPFLAQYLITTHDSVSFLSQKFKESRKDILLKLFFFPEIPSGLYVSADPIFASIRLLKPTGPPGLRNWCWGRSLTLPEPECGSDHTFPVEKGHFGRSISETLTDISPDFLKCSNKTGPRSEESSQYFGRLLRDTTIFPLCNVYDKISPLLYALVSVSQ